MDFQLNLQSDLVQHAHPHQPLCVASETPTREVLRLLKQHNTGSALVCRDKALLGIFTERDALKLMAHDGDLDAPIESVMIADPVTVSSNSSVGEAITKMSQGGYRRLPIVDEANRVLGIVKVSGILHYLVEHFPEMIYNLPPAPHHMMQQREGA